MINRAAQPINLPSFTPIATIQRVVAGSYGIAVKHLLSDLREFSWERHVAIYISRELTGKSLPVIGRAFSRDHTTILWACRRVKRAMDDNPQKRADVEALLDALQLSPENDKTGDNSLRKNQESDRTEAKQTQERIAA